MENEEELPEESESEEEETEINLEEVEEVEYVYGIMMPTLPEGLQPLECVVLIKGIMMDSGQPTVTALGSEGMTPWEAAGMLQMEAQRLIQGYVFGGMGSTGFFEDDDDDEEEDE
jgi:hypothetical protein